jgi:riboflavin kinase/FMN adenylyltransferase
MKTILLEDFIKDNNEYSHKNIALCIGVFDGLHLGHQEILNKVLDSQLYSVVMTFNTNPKMASGRKQKEKPLLTSNLKTRLLDKMGFDLQVIIDFSEKISKLSADEFLYLLCKNLTINKLIVGEDFQLGNPKASIKARKLQEHLSSYSKETKVVITKAIIDKDDGVISSSRIRQLVKKGKMNVVHDLLGREYLLDLGLTPSQFSGSSMLIKAEDVKQLLPCNGKFTGFWVQENLKTSIEVKNNVLYITPYPNSSAQNKTLAIC